MGTQDHIDAFPLADGRKLDPLEFHDAHHVKRFPIIREDELADPQIAATSIRRTVKRFGALDCLVGNAGIWDFNASIVDLPEDRIGAAFDELFGVNVKGYLLGAKAAYRELARTRGNIIFTVSNAGFYPCGGGPLYTASKHAVVGLIRQLAYELAPKIRVNGVAPGAIPTDLRGPRSLEMAERSIASVPLKDIVERGLPLGKLPEPRDYTGSYVLLASNENSSTATGGVIICEGGIGIRGFTEAAGGRNPASMKER